MSFLNVPCLATFNEDLILGSINASVQDRFSHFWRILIPSMCERVARVLLSLWLQGLASFLFLSCVSAFNAFLVLHSVNRGIIVLLFIPYITPFGLPSVSFAKVCILWSNLNIRAGGAVETILKSDVLGVVMAGLKGTCGETCNTLSQVHAVWIFFFLFWTLILLLVIVKPKSSVFYSLSISWWITFVSFVT